jgi:hypothetical protein
MERMGADSFLYALTCILPWAVDLLSQRPNCLMTDSTFKCCRPYALAILHAVFANESIPIAFGLAPTETADSYARIYTHLQEVLQRIPVETRMRIAETRKDEDKPAPVPESETWPDAIDDDDDHDDDMSACGIARGSPRGLEEEGNCSATAPEASSVGTLPQPLDPFLAELPLVTDQGTALQSFVKRFNLEWRLCHRHIIESVGANSLIGQWVKRILACYTYAQYRSLCETISVEMSDLDKSYPRQGRAFDTLQRLLGNLHDDHPLSTTAHWALWERLGCPRTTNSAESVNGHLNFDVKGDNDFMSRLVRTIKHFHLRYQTRNQWRDRSLQRHRMICFPTEEARGRSWWSEGKYVFERALHNVAEFTDVPKRQFPLEVADLMLCAELELKQTSLVPPGSWAETVVSSSPPKTIRRTLSLNETSSMTMRDHMAWEIAWSIRDMQGAEWWDRNGIRLYHGVLDLANTLEITEDNVEPFGDQAAHWYSRSVVWAESLATLVNCEERTAKHRLAPLHRHLMGT